MSAEVAAVTMAHIPMNRQKARKNWAKPMKQLNHRTCYTVAHFYSYNLIEQKAKEGEMRNNGPGAGKMSWIALWIPSCVPYTHISSEHWTLLIIPWRVADDRTPLLLLSVINAVTKYKRSRHHFSFIRSITFFCFSIFMLISAICHSIIYCHLPHFTSFKLPFYGSTIRAFVR